MSTDVVGHLIEVISGQKLDAYLKQHVLEPLGMRDTGFVIADSQVPRFAANYERQADGRLKMIDDPAQSLYRQASFLSGGGGLVSTVHDYYRFTAMLLNRGELDGVRLLGRKTVELMTMNHLPGGADLTGSRRGGHVHGDRLCRRGLRPRLPVNQSPARAQVLGTPGEHAWGGAASTAFWIDPAEDLIVIFMTQLMPSSSYPLRRELRVLTYAALVD